MIHVKLCDLVGISFHLQLKPQRLFINPIYILIIWQYLNFFTFIIMPRLLA